MAKVHSESSWEIISLSWTRPKISFSWHTQRPNSHMEHPMRCTHVQEARSTIQCLWQPLFHQETTRWISPVSLCQNRCIHANNSRSLSNCIHIEGNGRWTSFYGSNSSPSWWIQVPISVPHATQQLEQNQDKGSIFGRGIEFSKEGGANYCRNIRPCLIHHKQHKTQPGMRFL